MLITHLSSKRQNIGLNSYNTPFPLTITYSSLQRTVTQMDLYPFWAPSIHLDQISHYSQQSTGSLLTKTYTFNGIATITFLLNMVFSTLLHIWQELFVQIHSYYKRSKGASFPIRPSLGARTTTCITPTNKRIIYKLMLPLVT